jgi:hypothetical protein
MSEESRLLFKAEQLEDFLRGIRDLSLLATILGGVVKKKPQQRPTAKKGSFFLLEESEWERCYYGFYLSELWTLVGRKWIEKYTLPFSELAGHINQMIQDD